MYTFEVDFLIVFIDFRIPDEWVLEKEYSITKTISIPSLPVSGKDALKPILFPSNSEKRQKARRKPLKQT